MPLNPPDIKELRAIVDWVNLAEDVREVSLKYGDMELFISRDRQQPAAPPTPAPVIPTAAAPAPAQAAADPAPPAVAAPVPSASEPSSPDALAPDEVLIKAPMVGTFYASPKPGAPNFVSVGDGVAADSVLCIVEVMKLMSNIEAQVEGTVMRILVENEQAVEYGQPLMVIKRRA
ncbi:acetyl-CoA carboxylase biotin carboxyl carrier protein [Arthrobacter sp. ISL-72]|uniref:acetyl-CoA carboxylase biotin carboxyl carrier protein n=1 Tax=Arthrobacter sp. ISL-72 TaxID=2819114 RepID=UPI0020353147|nr:acetyl-CoA carboxylase biotin carboxyl carrier protein [Arthrobacter sp. ISL-72]